LLDGQGKKADMVRFVPKPAGPATSSGRFAVIDDGLGYSLVPWRLALEQHVDRHTSGVVREVGGADWRLRRKRGLCERFATGSR
jgi:hypothetical protein